MVSKDVYFVSIHILDTLFILIGVEWFFTKWKLNLVYDLSLYHIYTNHYGSEIDGKCGLYFAFL